MTARLLSERTINAFSSLKAILSSRLEYLRLVTARQWLSGVRPFTPTAHRLVDADANCVKPPAMVVEVNSSKYEALKNTLVFYPYYLLKDMCVLAEAMSGGGGVQGKAA